MPDRLDLQESLERLLGSRNVYFQPPASVRMSYPAIRYCLSDIGNRFADNSVYNQFNSYEVTVIDPNPDSDIFKKVSTLPMCRFLRHYTADNLNHWVFAIQNSQLII